MSTNKIRCPKRRTAAFQKTRALSVRQMQALDRWAIEKIGIPSLVLMENAGRHVAGEVLRLLRSQRCGRVVIICGSGNNGGDGLVAARHLLNAGIAVEIFHIGALASMKPDAQAHYRILKRSGHALQRIGKINASLRRQICRATLVVDAVFGVGLSRDITGLHADIITAMNRCARCIVAVDVPSGLDGTTGEIHGVCIKADVTVTFARAKQGFYKKHGPRQTGRVTVVDIGIPEAG